MTAAFTSPLLAPFWVLIGADLAKSCQQKLVSEVLRAFGTLQDPYWPVFGPYLPILQKTFSHNLVSEGLRAFGTPQEAQKIR